MGEIIIDSYTRKQAIEDGVLFDASVMAKEVGCKPPVAISQPVWEILNNYPKGQGQSLDGRLWDLLWMLYVTIRQGGGDGDTVMFRALMLMPRADEPLEYTFKSVIGPGDDWEPVITIVMPDED